MSCPCILVADTCHNTYEALCALRLSIVNNLGGTLLAEGSAHLFIHICDRLLSLPIHIEDLQKGFVHTLIAGEARLQGKMAVSNHQKEEGFEFTFFLRACQAITLEI